MTGRLDGNVTIVTGGLVGRHTLTPQQEGSRRCEVWSKPMPRSSDS